MFLSNYSHVFPMFITLFIKNHDHRRERIFKAYLIHVVVILKLMKKTYKNRTFPVPLLGVFPRISPLVFLSYIVHRPTPLIYISVTVEKDVSLGFFPLVMLTVMQGLWRDRFLPLPLRSAFPLDPVSNLCCLSHNFVDSVSH